VSSPQTTPTPEGEIVMHEAIRRELMHGRVDDLHRQARHTRMVRAAVRVPRASGVRHASAVMARRVLTVLAERRLVSPAHSRPAG
jgi:hypothetical protein